jgi:hypothetical protein
MSERVSKGSRVGFVKVMLLSALILQLGFGLVSGVGYAARPTPVTPSFLTATTVNKAVGLELTVHLEKIKYDLGEPVNITLTLTDISNKTVHLWLWSDIAWDYQVFNSTNSLMFDYLSDVFTFGSVDFFPVNITAGQSITAPFVWPQAYGPIPFSTVTPLSPPVSIGGGINITWVSLGGAVTLVSPGIYHIVGRFSNSTFTLQTPSLQIIIGYTHHEHAPHNFRNLNLLGTIAKPNLINGHSHYVVSNSYRKNRR